MAVRPVPEKDGQASWDPWGLPHTVSGVRGMWQMVFIGQSHIGQVLYLTCKIQFRVAERAKYITNKGIFPTK